MVYFVLDEEIDQRHQGSEEKACQALAPLDGGGVWRAQGNTACRPWQSANDVGYHENIVPIVIIRRCDVRPATTSQGPQKAHGGDEARELGIGPTSQNVPQANERKTRP